jgi:hypothetical protein
MSAPNKGGGPTYDRALLLHGSKRNEILTLREVQQYGSDSFGDPDYVQLYAMKPAEWYARGIRLLGRTTVECTRDSLADRIGRDVASVTAIPVGAHTVYRHRSVRGFMQYALLDPPTHSAFRRHRL